MANLSLKDNKQLIDQKYTKPETGIPEGDLSTEVRDILNSISNGQGYLLKGTANFNSITGTVINHSIGHTNYNVTITPTNNPNGYLGEYWVEKAMTSFVVKCSGTSLVSFDYIVE